MPFWNRKKNWEDEYDEFYVQDRRAELKKGHSRFRFIPHLLLLAFIGALFIGAAGVISGPTMVEKLLTSLATPVGVIWIVLLLMVYFCLLLRQAWPACVGFLCWLVLTIGGNAMFANALAKSIEMPFEKVNVLDMEPFDAVIVLGGGTDTNLGGFPQGSPSGADRVIVAAKLFHNGLVKKLICTGSQKYRAPADMHPRDEARELLISLGVPQDVLLRIKGKNTSEEMANLNQWMADQSEAGQPIGNRIGLLTSAYHLPRATRLAKSHGLELIPIPSNFLAEHHSASPNLVVPSAEYLDQTARVTKEYLARIVGR